jgi:hypothetical protein
MDRRHPVHGDLSCSEYQTFKRIVFDRYHAETGFSSGRTDKDPMQRLRDLEALRKDKLIAKDEFDRKRKEIMAEKW